MARYHEGHPREGLRRRSAIPFMRFFQIIIRAHMDNYPEIRRRSSYQLAPNYQMEKIRPPSVISRIPNLRILDVVLGYADPSHVGVSAYRASLGQPGMDSQIHQVLPSVHNRIDGVDHRLCSVALGAHGAALGGVKCCGWP